MKRINNRLFKDIKTINYSLYMLLFYFNMTFYLYSEVFKSYVVFFLIGNVFFVIIFYITNKIHSREYDKQKNLLIELIKLQGNNFHGLLSKDFVYDDLNNTYKLFKRLFVKKNILQKDFDDIQVNFKRFIPQNFLQDIGEELTGRIEVGMSVEKKLHIMFVDIIGFTHISEKMPSGDALKLLNIYFDAIVEIVKENGGYIDKFLGDGVMIIFDHKQSDTAIYSAIEIGNIINKLNIGRMNQIRVGIGINSGKATLGTVGSKNRMDISIIGDSVNIASRLESLTRTEKESIIISDDTFALIKNKKLFATQSLGKQHIYGKENKVHIYGVKNEYSKNGK